MALLLPSLFTGKERDTESGNEYFEARYYSSAMGRFMSPDWSAKEEPVPYAKLDDPQTLNLYSYVQNNPLVGVDKDGHDPLTLTAAWGAIQTGAAEVGTGLVAGASAAATVVVGIAAEVFAPTMAGSPAEIKWELHNKAVAESASSSDSDEKKKAEPPQLAAGKQAHKDEEVRPGEESEVALPDGSGRMDRYNKGTGHIREIKPDNARQERAGNRQLERYKKAMEKATDKPHTTELTKYKPKNQ